MLKQGPGLKKNVILMSDAIHFKYIIAVWNWSNIMDI